MLKSYAYPGYAYAWFPKAANKNTIQIETVFI
jgi:hypothetical protein